MPKKLSKKAIEGIAVGLVILLLVVPSFIFGWSLARSMNREYVDPADPVFHVDLDGIITEDEWKAADYYNFPFYLDVDNKIDPQENKANVDGWNYISIGEDEDNYYVGLDLCSDRTNNMEGEWISFGMGNRIPEHGGKMAFYALEDFGFEYLMYNVSEDQEFDHELILSGGTNSYYNIPFVPEYNSYELIRGELGGDYRDLWARDDWEYEYDIEKVVTLTSNYYENTSLYEPGDYVTLDFAINVSKMLPTYNASDLIPTITDFDLNMDIMGTVSASSLVSIYNETVDTIWFSVLEHGPMLVDFDDPQYMTEFNNLSINDDWMFDYLTADLDHSKINTTNGMFYFSLIGYNPTNTTDPTAFELYLNRISFKFNIQGIDTTVGTSISPGNYEIAFAFGTSDKCAENHRMFEFRVAKSEFPFVEDDMLYVNVAGYGTMGMEGTNYWIYPGYNEHIFAGPLFKFYEYDDNFLKLDMSAS